MKIKYLTETQECRENDRLHLDLATTITTFRDTFTIDWSCEFLSCDNKNMRLKRSFLLDNKHLTTKPVFKTRIFIG